MPERTPGSAVPPAAPPATLLLPEAVALAHALIGRLCESSGVRALFVKGPTAVHVGARPRRPSSDVDVLCEPGGMELLGAALEAAGWRRRVRESSVHRLEHAAKYLFDHSTHYIHDEWPCDLDVHFTFPGFLAPEAEIFEALWARRTTVTLAGVPLASADLLGQAAIVALHSLRDPGTARSSTDLAHVAAVLGGLSTTELEEFSALAAATGSSQTLRPLLEQVGAPVLPSPWDDPESLRRWLVRTTNGGTPTTSWLIELRHTPWQRRPALVWRALFLPADELLSGHVGLDPDRSTVVRLQVARWARGARHARAGLRAARRSDGALPGMGLPDAGLPGVGLPDAGLPGMGLPDAGLPGVGLADADPQGEGRR